MQLTAEINRHETENQDANQLSVPKGIERATPDSASKPVAQSHRHLEQPQNELMEFQEDLGMLIRLLFLILHKWR